MAAKLSRRGPNAQRDGYKVYMWLEDNTGSSSTPPQTLVVFPINPEDVQTFYPTRVNTQQTIGSAYQDNWGPGVGKVQLSGITGWGNKNPDGTGDPKNDTSMQDGYQFFITLRELHKKYQELCGTSDPNKVSLRILIPPGDFADIAAATASVIAQDLLGLIAPQSPIVTTPVGTQFGFFRVSADNFQAGQSRSEPQLYRYRWEMTVLADLLSVTHVNPSLPFMIDPSTLNQTDDPLQNVTPGNAGSSTGSGTGSGTGKGNAAPPANAITTRGLTSTVTGPAPAAGSASAPAPAKEPSAAAAADALKAQKHANDAPPSGTNVPKGTTVVSILASDGITLDEWNAYNLAVTGSPLVNTSSSGGVLQHIDPNAPASNSTQIIIPGQTWITTYRALTGTSGPQATGGH